eukprot:jgi/Chrzof1/5077/Cz15g10270.t1
MSANETLNYASHMFTVAQVGRLGSLQQSAMSLASTAYNITGLSLVVGIGSGLQTFSGQAYGAHQWPLLGVILQRATIICWLTALLPLALWTQAHRLLLLLGQQEALASLAARYIQVCSPALLLSAVANNISTYLSTQTVVTPLTAVAAASAVATPLLNHLLIHTAGQGLLGAAWSYVLVQALLVLLLLGTAAWYNRLQPDDKKPWTGISRYSLSNWGAYLAVAVPSLAMICLDWWAFEGLTLLAGLLPNATVAVAVTGICFGFHVIVFFMVQGLSVAVAIRVSNELGAGRGGAARKALITGVVLGIATGSSCTLPMWLHPKFFAAVFSTDPVVIDLVVACLPGLLISLLGDSINTVLSGAIRGAGRQWVGMLVNLGIFWGFGLPLAGFMALKWGFGVPGLWYAMAVTSSVQAVVLSTVVSCLNWEQESHRAKVLVKSQSGHHAVLIQQ